MLANSLTDRIQVQLRTSTQTSMGESIIWTPVQKVYARVIPLDAAARAQYQQLNSEVTHKIVMRGAVTLNLGLNRFKWNDKTLEPVEPAQELDGATIVMVKEV